MELSFDWPQVVQGAWRLGLAYLLALPIGWERESESRGMGLRTFPLTAMASCAYVLVGSGFTPEGQSRIIQGLLAGIGFLGAGAIMKGEGEVRGAATAASIFNTGVIGAAVALERVEIAIVLSLLNLVTLRLLLPVKKRISPNAKKEEKENQG